MNKNKNLQIHFVTMCAISAMVLAACGESDATPTPTDAPKIGVTLMAKGDTKSTNAESTQAPTTKTDTNPADTRTVSDVGNDLSGLQSFRAHTVWSFEGVDDKGAKKQGSIEITQEVIKDKSTHMKYSGTGEGGDPGKQSGFESYQIGTTTFMMSEKEGKPACFVMSSADNKLNQEVIYKPSDLLGNLSNAKLVSKGEDTNGVKADHYTASQSEGGGGIFGVLLIEKGDVWLAQDGGYVVKYVGAGSGKGNTVASAGMKEATYTWTYDVTDVNALKDFVLPPECVAARPANDLPVLPGATDQGQVGPMTNYKVKGTVKEVADKITKALTDSGWAAAEGSGQADDSAFMNFTKGKRKLAVIVGKDGEDVSVLMTDTIEP